MQLTILIPNDGDTWEKFLRRLEAVEGDVIVVLPAADDLLPSGNVKWGEFLTGCMRCKDRLELATKHKGLADAASIRGLEVISRMSELREALADHPQRDEALRVFSPYLWQQQLKSHLQSLGILSLPKLRVWTLIVVSVLLFFFVLFRLLPSAEIHVSPREDSLTQTANVFLVLSGSTMDIPERVRKMELMPVRVTVNKTITIDEISKKFIGESSSLPVKITNISDEDFSLRRDSRIANQAGMVFRIQESVFLEPGDSITIRAIADDLDLYGEIIGDRGNVPAGLKWEFPALPENERKMLEVINTEEGQGGTTSYTTVLTQEDLDVAKKKLEQELLSLAKQLVNEERDLFNSSHEEQVMEILHYDELTHVEYSDFVMPTQFLGQEVKSVPVEGTLTYTMYAYDTQHVLNLLSKELTSHVEDGKRLLDASLGLDRLVAHVIDYEDDLSWIKLTIDLSGTEEYVLDPLTPTGARFGKKVRSRIVGLHKDEALRIVKNLPEVEHAEIKLWPPWSRTLPTIPAHIAIVPFRDE